MTPAKMGMNSQTLLMKYQTPMRLAKAKNNVTIYATASMRRSAVMLMPIMIAMMDMSLMRGSKPCRRPLRRAKPSDVTDSSKKPKMPFSVFDTKLFLRADAACFGTLSVPAAAIHSGSMIIIWCPAISWPA